MKKHLNEEVLQCRSPRRIPEGATVLPVHQDQPEERGPRRRGYRQATGRRPAGQRDRDSHPPAAQAILDPLLRQRYCPAYHPPLVRDFGDESSVRRAHQRTPTQ